MTPTFPITCVTYDYDYGPNWKLIFKNPTIWLSDPTTTKEMVYLYLGFFEKWQTNHYFNSHLFHRRFHPHSSLEDLLCGIIEFYAGHPQDEELWLSGMSAEKAKRELNQLLVRRSQA